MNDASILDRYLNNLPVGVEPFARCLRHRGWRLTLPGPPCAMLHFVVEGAGWLSAPDGLRQRIWPDWVALIPPGKEHALETFEPIDAELKIDCVPSDPPVRYIVAGESGPPEIKVACGTPSVRYGEAIGLFDCLTEILIVGLSGVPLVPDLFRQLLGEQAADAPGRRFLIFPPLSYNARLLP